MSVTFQKSGGTLYTFRSPQLANELARTRIQARGRTHDGALLVADKGLTTRAFRLSFRELTATEKANFITFFTDDAKGSLVAFTYTDHASAAHTAQFLSESLDFVEVWNGRFNLDVELEVTS